MAEGTFKFLRHVKRDLKRECALRVSKQCESTYDGDADDEKTAGLAVIECVRVYLTESDSVDIHICENCLQTKVREGWEEVAGK